MNLDEWEQVARRPDGSTHKFSEKAWKDHPRIGYIGLQDHGSPCWFKNIKILPLTQPSHFQQIFGPASAVAHVPGPFSMRFGV